MTTFELDIRYRWCWRMKTNVEECEIIRNWYIILTFVCVRENRRTLAGVIPLRCHSSQQVTCSPKWAIDWYSGTPAAYYTNDTWLRVKQNGANYARAPYCPDSNSHKRPSSRQHVERLHPCLKSAPIMDPCETRTTLPGPTHSLHRF